MRNFSSVHCAHNVRNLIPVTNYLSIEKFSARALRTSSEISHINYNIFRSDHFVDVILYYIIFLCGVLFRICYGYGLCIGAYLIIIIRIMMCIMEVAPPYYDYNL